MSQIEDYLATKPEIEEAVVGYIVDEINEKVLLVERVDPKSGLGKGRYVGVGGRIIEDEDPEQAIIRETREETSMEITEPTKMGEVTFLWVNQPWNMHVHVYVINQYAGEAQYVTGESVRPEWFDLDKIPYDRMFDDNKDIIPKVLSGKKINATFLLKNKGQIVEKQVNILDE